MTTTAAQSGTRSLDLRTWHHRPAWLTALALSAAAVALAIWLIVAGASTNQTNPPQSVTTVQNHHNPGPAIPACPRPHGVHYEFC
jgi:anti-sigma-K factor RskA